MKPMYTFLVLIASMVAALAQEPSAAYTEEWLSQTEAIPALQPIPDITTTAVQSIQQGAQHMFFIEQIHTGGSPGTTALLQIGQAHLADIALEGAGNRVQVIQQGAGNQYTLDLIGDDMTTQVWQSGTNNAINQSLEVSGLSFTLIQNGHNNTIDHLTDNPAEATALQIRQTGADMHLIIRNSYQP